MQKIYLSVLLVIGFVCKVFPQVPFSEIGLEDGQAPLVKCMLSGDSILLTHQLTSYAPKTTMWVRADGTTKVVYMGEVDRNKALLAVSSQGNKQRYFFLETKSRNQIITSLTVDIAMGTAGWDPGQLEIPGLLLGNFFDGDLYLICNIPGEKIVRILQVSELQIKDEKKFTLNEALLLKKRTRVAFITPGKPLSPDEAIAPIKIYRSEEILTITVDDPFDEFRTDQMFYKTTIYRLELKSGRASSRFFLEQSQYPFTSTLFANHLYRVKSFRKEAHLQIFDLTTGRPKTSDLSGLSLDENHFAYQSIDATNKIESIKLKAAIPLINYVIPDTIGSETVLRIGGRFGRSPTVPVLPGLGSLVSLATNVTIMSLYNGLDEDIYFYLKGSPETEFKYTADSKLISQDISAYDLKTTTDGKRYWSKSYLLGANFAYGVYLEKKSDKIQVLRFNQR